MKKRSGLTSFVRSGFGGPALAVLETVMILLVGFIPGGSGDRGAASLALATLTLVVIAVFQCLYLDRVDANVLEMITGVIILAATGLMSFRFGVSVITLSVDTLTAILAIMFFTIEGMADGESKNDDGEDIQ